MTVFEKAKQLSTREEFIETREKSQKMADERFNAMKEYILSDACADDLSRLESGDYFLDPPIFKQVPKNFRDRKRSVYYFTGSQSDLLKLLMFVLRDYEDHYSDRLYSFRSDRSGKDFLMTLRSGILNKYYILKTDVSNYVGSIVPEIILPVLKTRYFSEDPDFYSFLEWLLMRKKCIRNGEVIDHNPGGMGGVALSNFFMNVYLQEMDDNFENRSPLYFRYSDDILICAETLEQAEQFKKEFYEILNRLQLHVNDEKTMIIPPGAPVEILGMYSYEGKLGISQHSLRKIQRKIRRVGDRLMYRTRKKEITKEEAARSFIGYLNTYFFGLKGVNRLSWARWSFPVLTDPESLKTIDHYCQDTIRRILHGSCRRSRMKIPYSRLNELGYKSLLYVFHHPKMIEVIRENNLAEYEQWKKNHRVLQ